MGEMQGHFIEGVAPGSPASAAGVKAGERLLRMDNQPIQDIIDYKIMEADERVRLLLMDKNGKLRRLAIHKRVNTPLGLQFASATIDNIKRCPNRCLFCFVHQNPKGLRSSLYIRDDDYRLSFLFGNFITLNELSSQDLQRIIRLRLSPLYVSVHATSPETRRRLFGTEKAHQGLENLRALLKEGIEAHLQVVLCPGYNTGPELKKTVEKLASMGPGVLSIALVPVGVTSHRSGALPPLRRLNSEEAREIAEEAARYQQEFLATRGSRLVYLADEIYNLSGLPIPEAEEYEGFPQLENGIGLSRLFLAELEGLPRPPLKPLARTLRATLATGREAAPLLEKLVQLFNQVAGLTLQLEIIDNRFFGSPVTVAGLLTGSDLEEGLKGKDPGEALFISSSLLKEGEDIFLDDMTLQQLQQVLQVPVIAAGGPEELVRAVADLVAGKAGGSISSIRGGSKP